jgi:cyclin H
METRTLTEDDVYRTTSQYRLWSFSPPALQARRQQTHDLAIQRILQQRASTTSNDASFLTLEESHRLLQRYVSQLRSTASHFKLPATLTATAAQYLRRFYLSNSPHTYPPKEVYKTVLYLATKTEGLHMKVHEFARRISTESESVLAAEYKVMQALRFTLDVRMPYRGLKGVLMEMVNLAEGRVGEVEHVQSKGAEELRGEMAGLGGPAEGSRTPWTRPDSTGHDGRLETVHLLNRVNAAYTAAKEVLDGPALMTDVYFLYTPSQLAFAALHIADPDLTSFYLSTKLPPPETTPVSSKTLSAIHSCAQILASFDESAIPSKEERTVLEERLEKCRDPTTKDLVKLYTRAKAGAGGTESDEEEKAEKARKRRAERERSAREGEDLFGPSLNGGGKG